MGTQMANRRKSQLVVLPTWPWFWEPLEDRTVPAQFVVTTITDNGLDGNPTVGSLRWAIVESNDNPGFDTITFEITDGAPGENPTIAVPAELPSVKDDLQIDGTSGAGSPGVQLVGDNLGSPLAANSVGLALDADVGLTVRGLVIRGFATQIFGALGTLTVQGNYIGTNEFGDFAPDFVNGTGIFVESGIAQIGGNSAFDANVIGGMRESVVVGIEGGTSVSAAIVGNFLGVAPDSVGTVGGNRHLVIASQANVTISENFIGHAAEFGMQLGATANKVLRSNQYVGNRDSFDRATSILSVAVDSALRTADSTLVNGSYTADPLGVYRVLIYWNAHQGLVGSLGGTEAQQLLDDRSDQASSAGIGVFSATLTGVPEGGYISVIVERADGTQWSPISLPVPILDLADSFERGVQPNLGSSYVTQLGSFSIGEGPSGTGTGLVARSNLSTMSIATVADLTVRDVALQSFVSVIQTGGRGNANLIARYAGPGDTNFYMARAANRINLEGGGIWVEIVRDIGGVRTTLSATRVGEDPSAGNMDLRFEVIGDRLTLWHRPISQADFVLLDTLVDDALMAPGFVGIRGVGGGIGGTGFDAFEVSSMAPTTPSSRVGRAELPPLVPLTNAADLHPAFEILQGSFAYGRGRNTANASPAIITGKGSNAAVVANAMNIALVFDFAFADVALSAAIDVANTGGRGNGALVWRHAGVDDQNFYMARIANRSGQFFLEVVRDNFGVRTVLDSRQIEGSSINLDVRMFGRTIEVTYAVNGGSTQFYTVFDSAIQALLQPGQAGIRGIGGNLNGVRFFDFTADPLIIP